MRAVMFRDFKTFPTVENIDVPEPGPGEVLLKVAGAGACHSDVAIWLPSTLPSARRHSARDVLG
jgi:alcohol dehydrogenase, propanol-preferring